MTKPRQYAHIDDFIDYGCMKSEPPKNEKYARWVLNYFRMSAILKNDFKEFMKDQHLYCTHAEITYRVTGASRLGDVWLTTNFTQDTGYELRVDINDCSNWTKHV